MRSKVPPPNGYEEVRECWVCGTEVLYKWTTWGNCWSTTCCPRCSYRWTQERYLRQFYLDLRNLIYCDGEWVPDEADGVKRRLVRSFEWAVKELGFAAADKLLLKAMKIFWHETKTRWVHDLRLKAAFQQRRSQRLQREGQDSP